MTRPSSRRNRDWLRGAHPAVEARVVRQRGDAVVGQELGGLLHRGAGQAVDDAGVAGVLGAQQVEQLGPRVVLGHDPVLDVRPVEARDEVPRVGSELRAGGRSRRAWPRSRSRSGRSAGRRASARAAPTAAGSRAGSRGPTATRSAPRRSRTARSGPGRAGAGCSARAAAPGRGRAGRARRRGRPPRPRRRSARSCVELRNPARTPSARQRVDLVLHEGDQRGDDDADARSRTSAGIW